MVNLFIASPSWALHLKMETVLNPISEAQYQAMTPTEPLLKVHTEINLSAPTLQTQFVLNKNLKIVLNSSNPNYSVIKIREIGEDSTYQINFTKPQKTFSLSYEGNIYYPIQEDYSPGIISLNGVSLFEQSSWYPKWGIPFTYQNAVTLQNTSSDWKAISPGKTEFTQNSTIFTQDNLIEEISLFAGPYVKYESQILTEDQKIIALAVYLRNQDSNLAQEYLKYLPQYINEYSLKIGPYPFENYSVVENFFETGLAFPGLTLLGPSVIRLPFIFNTSLPHEILHSWWGNSVYVDYEKGNWCEGLTNFMADHAQQKNLNKGSEYRRKALQSFQDFTRQEGDFPLRKFTSRTDFTTQAVGYSKGMMVFQMLETLLGEELFNQSLKDFYKDHKFKTVSFNELQSTFEQTTHQKLDDFFQSWLDQTGAPLIELKEIKLWTDSVTKTNETSKPFRLKLALAQSKGPKFNFFSPVNIKFVFANGESQIQKVILQNKNQVFNFNFSYKPTKVQVDPEFQTFRQLLPEERPPTLALILGEVKNITISLPSSEIELHPENKVLWEQWANEISNLYKHQNPQGEAAIVRIISDKELIPSQGILWILGSQNQHAQMLKTQLVLRGFLASEKGWSFKNQFYNYEEQSFFAVDNVKNLNIIWSHLAKLENSTTVTNKLKHYSSFGLLQFKETTNSLKTTWTILKSPLEKDIP